MYWWLHGDRSGSDVEIGCATVRDLDGWKRKSREILCLSNSVVDGVVRLTRTPR